MMSGGGDPPPEDVSCLDMVNESVGISTLEVDQPSGGGGGGHGRGPPQRQISSVSLPKKKSDIGGASANLVNSIVGAGIIGIPYALRESGLVAGVFLLVLVAWCTDKSLRIIIELASFHPQLKHRGVLTFEDLMFLPFGKWGSNFILLNMFVLAYGAMVAYLLIIKDTVPTILGITDNPTVGSFLEREVVMIVASLSIMVPLSMQRDMASLALTSFVSVAADTFLVLFVSAYSPIRETVGNAGGFGTVLKTNIINSHLFIGLGILSTAMACQHSAFIVSGSLHEKTSARWATVTFRSLTIATVLCAILGICGYLGFLENTLGDVLNNFEPDTLEANAARFLLAITMFFTYPMEAFVARHVAVQLLYDGDMDGHHVNEQGESVPDSKWFGILSRRHQVTLLIYAATLVPALLVDDLGPVLSITGSLGGSCLSYIGPGLVYLGIHGEAFMAYINEVLENHNRKSSTSTAETVTGDDLPIEGNANAALQTPNAGTTDTPWWWIPLGMPLWVTIATAGSEGMHTRISELEREHGPSSPTAEDEQIETIGPCKQDFFVSIFFICFGMLAAVVGLISNIYVQINQIEYFSTA